jgi:glycosyltransferase involved in cell wall biosynthesis
MKVLIYPKAHGNPYHELLYGALQEAHPTDRFTYLEATPGTVLGFPFVMAAKRLQGYRIFHLHWHAFYIDPKYHIPFSKQFSYLNTVWSLYVLRMLGIKLVWTAHDALPHEPTTSNDAAITRLTAKLASALIVHSTQNIDELAALHANTRGALVIPHGNYDGAYPVSLSPAESRARLGVAADERMVLFFGNIRPYKGIDDELLPAFVRLGGKTRLIIAGKCRDPELEKKITAYTAKYPNISFVNESIPEEDVAMYFNAADVVCLPFKTITTSGSVILAATFGKPIVTPRLGAIRDIPSGVGVLYDPHQEDALFTALQTVLESSSQRQAMAKASRQYADTLSWSIIAEKTYKAYSNKFSGAGRRSDDRRSRANSTT